MVEVADKEATRGHEVKANVKLLLASKLLALDLEKAKIRNRKWDKKK